VLDGDLSGRLVDFRNLAVNGRFSGIDGCGNPDLRSEKDTHDG
jgi:hypothetical protein